MPCSFTYTYDTSFVSLQVVNIGDSALQIIDLENSWINRTITLGDNLEYDGYSTHDAPEGFYWLHLSNAPYDSLFIQTKGGGGSVANGGGTYHFYKYEVVRE